MEYSVTQGPDLGGPGRESGRGGGVASLGSVMSDLFLGLLTGNNNREECGMNIQCTCTKCI